MTYALNKDGTGPSDSETERPNEKATFWDRFSEHVDLEFAYIPLLACCFVSGLTDGTIYNGELSYFICTGAHMRMAS